LFRRMAGLQLRPMNSTGAPDMRAIRGRPSAIWRAGPRGPSGVMPRAPTLSCFNPSRRAWEPPLARSSLSLLAEEPRMAGMPSRPMARAMNWPSGLSEISPVTGWARSCGQQTGARARRECQKTHSTPPPCFQTYSATDSIKWVQRKVAKQKRIQAARVHDRTPWMTGLRSGLMRGSLQTADTKQRDGQDKALPSRGRVGWGGGTTVVIEPERRRRLRGGNRTYPASTPSPDPFPLEGKGRCARPPSRRCLRRFAIQRLLLRQTGVEAALADQLGVGALFDHAARFEHIDAVGVADRGQAVGDHEGGPALHEALEGGLDQGLALGVE